MKCEAIISAGILLGNLVIVGLMYLTVGWHFIRGYEEVANFVVFPCAIGQAGTNLLIAVPIALVGRWRRSTSGRTALASLSLAAALTLLSPVIAPIIGRIAKRNLWIETPLVEAARYGDSDLVITLLTRGANPNVKQTALGTTPLHYMAARSELKAVNALLADGADPNAADDGLETPLHWTVRHRAGVRVIEALVKHGADPTLEDGEGKSPVEYTYVIPNPLKKHMLHAMGREEIGDPAEEVSSPQLDGGK